MAIELLVHADNRQAARLELDSFKHALVAAGYDPELLFAAEASVTPVVQKPWQGDPAEDEGVDFDYSDVDWQQDASADTWAAMQAALADAQVSVRADTGQDDDGPLMEDQGDSREWI